MDNLMKNVATDEAQFNSQKSQIQNEVQLGETAASIAAKAPVSPETVIEGIKMGEELRAKAVEYAVPILVLTFSVITSWIAWNLYAKKSKNE